MTVDAFREWFKKNIAGGTSGSASWTFNNNNDSMLESSQIGGFTSVFVNRVDPLTGGYMGFEPVEILKHNLLATGGRDYLHAQAYNNFTSGTAGLGAVYIALAENSGSPVAGDTVVSGEVSGGLTRTSGDTLTHVSGTNTSIVQKTFTTTNPYSGIQKSGLFNHPTTGTLVHQNTFTPTQLASGDQIQVQWTLTLG